MEDHEAYRRILNTKDVVYYSFRDLENYVKSFNLENILALWGDDKKVRYHTINQLRFIMNYFSACYTLKSIMQSRIPKMKITPEFRKKYNDRMNQTFKEDITVQFFEACRNVFVHEGIPFANTEFKLTEEGELNVLVIVKDITESEYANGKGIDFAKDNDIINLFIVCKYYQGKIIEFYTWFFENIEWDINKK